MIFNMKQWIEPSVNVSVEEIASNFYKCEKAEKIIELINLQCSGGNHPLILNQIESLLDSVVFETVDKAYRAGLEQGIAIFKN